MVRRAILPTSTHFAPLPTLQPKHKNHGRVRKVFELRDSSELVPRVPPQSRGDGDVLLAIDRISHRRRVETGADIDPPKLLQGRVVESHDGAVEQRRYDEPAA